MRQGPEWPGAADAIIETVWGSYCRGIPPSGPQAPLRHQFPVPAPV